MEQHPLHAVPLGAKACSQCLCSRPPTPSLTDSGPAENTAAVLVPFEDLNNQDVGLPFMPLYGDP